MKLFFSFILAITSNIALAENTAFVKVGEFSKGHINQWNNKTFSRTTDYKVTLIDGITVLKAKSHSAASGLFKQQKIDLQKTPFLNWHWRIDDKLGNIYEQSKAGDDYSARIYVVVDAGWAFWKTKAINYVWASNTQKGSVWPNAFAGTNAMMIAVRSTDDKTHTWYQEKRNVLKDLQQQFGSNIRYIDAIALMTDTDNAKGSAVAYYGDIYFTEK